MTATTLSVPGASLYFETRGQGDTLLIIPGGPQDAGVFSELADLLAERFTVVTYDPRGNSRTTTDAPLGELDIDQQADDAAVLIAAVGEGPAFVFGTSGGAQIGLNLAARHADKVKVLLAHEPPSMMLLADPEPVLAADRALKQTYLDQGVEAAMAQFFGENGLEDGPPPEEMEMPPEAMETFMRVSGNFAYWLEHGMIPLSVYEPDVVALKAGGPKVVVAIGEGSAGQPIEAMSKALADALGVAPVSFPGDHMGFESQGPAFAEAMVQAFE